VNVKAKGEQLRALKPQKFSYSSLAAAAKVVGKAILWRKISLACKELLPLPLS